MPPSEASGQTEQDTEGGGAGEIVVTARRSAERLQDVPLSINALTADDLLKRGATDLQDVANYTPGLRFTDFLSKFNGNAVIRGLSQTNVQSAIGNTGVFLDGVYLQRGYMVDSQMGDFERIEVVKGPQSALYGQNTFSGAINYVLRPPSDELRVNGQASAGSGGYRDVRLGVGGPLIGDVLSGRIYYATSSFDGTWENNFPGAGSTDLANFGGYRRENFSAALRLTPMDGLTITGSYYVLTRNEKIRAFYTIDGNLLEDRLNCGAIGANGSPRLWCGNLPSDPSGKRSGLNTGNYPDGLFTAPQPGMRGKTEVYRAALEYKFLEDFTFNYDYGKTRGQGIEQSAFASNSFFLTAGSYRVPTNPAISLQREAGLLKYDSHDARIAFDNNGPFKLDFGYFHSKAWDSFLFGLRYRVTPGVAIISDNNDPLSAGGVSLFNNRLTEYWTDSAYARTSLELFGSLTLAAEGRYTHTRLRTVDRLTPNLAPLEATYDNFTPRFSVEYKLSPAMMIYASAAKGVKAGGFNGYVSGTYTLTADERSFGEEENWTYELGTKGSAFDNRLSYALAGFYIDWSKRQIASPPTAFLLNPPPNSNSGAGAVPSIYVSGGSAESYGVELSANYRMSDAFSFNGSFAWQHATAKAGAIAPAASIYCDDIVCRRDGNVEGNFLGNVPWFQGTVGVEFRQPIRENVDFFFGVDEVYRGKLYTDTTNTSSIAPYALTNLRFGLETDKFRAFVWAKNLLNKEYVEASFVVPSIYQYNASLGELRTIGLTISVNY